MHIFFAVIFTTFLILGSSNSSAAQPKRQRVKHSTISQKSNAENEELIARLEKAIPRLMRDADVPGLSLALIKNGEIFRQRGFGVKNVETKEPVDDSTVFEAASLSKPVFAYAVLKMAESGKLDLDAPLNKYLPDSYVETDARANQITARRVLMHATGFPNWRAPGKPLRIYFAPGERFSYSGEGFVYLQKAIERLSGEPLDEFMKRTVFEPLGMTNSSYVWQEKYERLKAFAHNSAGETTGRSKPAQASAAASLHTTALDYAKFVRAILKREGLTEAIVREMLKPQIKANEKCAVCVERADAGRLSPSISWGLGWGLQKTASGDFFWHWGDNGNVKSYVAASDKTKTGIVLFANSANGLSIADEIARIALGVSQPSLAWLEYEPYDSPPKTLLRDFLARGDEAFVEYRRRGKKLNESQMIWIGQQLLAKKKFVEAVKFFEASAESFPKSPKAFAALGEAHLRMGDYALAVENYRRAVRSNPSDANAADILKRLQEAQFKAPPNLLESYAGDYETPFGILSIIKSGDRLVGRISGEPETILLAQSETQFTAAIEGIRLTFVKNDKGQVTHAVILARGQEIQANRVR